MHYETVTLQEKRVLGIGVRTANDAPDMMQKVGDVWRRFFGEGLAARLPGRQGEANYGLYYDYGPAGDYQMLAAAESDAEATAEWTAVCIPAGRYAKFTFRGDPQKDTGAFWGVVWNTPLPRAYTVDFEEYPPTAFGCEESEIYIYVALKD